MKGLTLSAKEQNRLQVLNGVLERHWSIKAAAPLLGVSERQGWRLLAAYRKAGARGLVPRTEAGYHPTPLQRPSSNKWWPWSRNATRASTILT
jgi:hypothetical protein